MKIVLTEFCKNNNFQESFRGTKIVGISPEEFEETLVQEEVLRELPGYAPFCRHLFVRNFAGAYAGICRITEENQHLLKSGYVARRPGELAVLSRWFSSSDVPAERAEFLDLILYSREQLLSEDGVQILPEGADWGIVAILSCQTLEETPMPPATMVRNALGPSEGGSGHPLDHEKYKESVAYWSEWATIN